LQSVNGCAIHYLLATSYSKQKDMPGAEQRPGQVRPPGRPNFQQFESGRIHTPGSGSGELKGRGLQGSAGAPLSGERGEKPEIHIGGTPIVTVRLVNGVQQDIPHLFVDNRGGQTHWWVERESIESWQERVRVAQESGDKRYEGVSVDRLPSSVTHNYPNIPSSILESQPEYANREWITLSYSLTPTQEEGRVALTPNQGDEVVVDEYTFLNTAAVSKDETTSFRRSIRLVVTAGEIQDEPLPTGQAEPKPQPQVDDEQ
jgi:hypothetical protein